MILPKARSGHPEPKSEDDFSAFEIPNPGKLHIGKMATKDPMVGAPVWIVARSDPFSAQRSWPAHIVEVREDVFIWRLETPFDFNHPSGSPLINHLGEVLSVLCGAGTFIDGTSIVHGPSLKAIERHLQSAENM